MSPFIIIDTLDSADFTQHVDLGTDFMVPQDSGTNTVSAQVAVQPCTSPTQTIPIHEAFAWAAREHGDLLTRLAD